MKNAIKKTSHAKMRNGLKRCSAIALLLMVLLTGCTNAPTNVATTYQESTVVKKEKVVYSDNDFNATFVDVKTDNEILGMSGASSNVFGIVMKIENTSNSTQSYKLRDIYVDDIYAGVSGLLNESTPCKLDAGKVFNGHFSGCYGEPGDISTAHKLEFKIVCMDENNNETKVTPVITIQLSDASK